MTYVSGLRAIADVLDSFALVCGSATLPEAGHCTGTKSRAWCMPSSSSANCCVPGPLSMQLISKKSAFSVCQWETIANPSEANPSQHHLKNSLPLLAVYQEIRCNIRKFSSHCLLGWAIQRVTPKRCLSPYPWSSLTWNLLLCYFSTWRTNQLLSMHRPP